MQPKLVNRRFKGKILLFRHGVTTPRWKKFNNMNIRLKDRIRLNNAIWRTWHIQCKLIVTYVIYECAFT